MSGLRLYLSLCLIGMLLPFLPVASEVSVNRSFPGWPTQFEQRPLQVLPLTQREAGFYRDFPGKVARFSDGQRELIIRWVTAPTRKLHPAADCFKGIGYHITPEPVLIDEQAQRWGSFIASKDTSRLQVQERVYDQAGNSWTDISAWYWAATLGDSTGPWWVVTIASNHPE